MKKRWIILLALGGALALAGVAVAVWWATPEANDFGTLRRMREHLVASLEARGAVARPASQGFADYRLGLNPLFALMFRGRELALFLDSRSDGKLAAASVSQFEIDKWTGRYFDCTFLFRPRPELAAPLFHGDALKPLPGVKGALYMDFYDPSGSLDLKAFFGERQAELEAAMARARPWWNTQDFGALTPHLDPFKSPWRVELREPAGAPPEEKERYYAALEALFQSYLAIYLDALDAQEPQADPAAALSREVAVAAFVGVLDREDVAVKMGRMLFSEKDFPDYFFDGFWAVPSPQARD